MVAGCRIQFGHGGGEAEGKWIYIYIYIYIYCYGKWIYDSMHLWYVHYVACIAHLGEMCSELGGAEWAS